MTGIPTVVSGRQLGTELSPLSLQVAVIESVVALAPIALAAGDRDCYQRLMNNAEAMLSHLVGQTTAHLAKQRAA